MSFLRPFSTLLTFSVFLGLTSGQLEAAKPAEKSTPVVEAKSTAKSTSALAKKEAALLKKLKLAKHETAIFVGDMHCATCAKKMAGKLYTVKGVMKVRTNVKEDVAIITPQQKKKLDVNALWKAAKTAGFPAVKLIGPQGTYVADPKTKMAKRVPTPTPVAAKQKSSKI